jgi:hypothetical protein
LASVYFDHLTHCDAAAVSVGGQPFARGERFYREKIIRPTLSSKSSATTIKRQPHPQHEVCMFIAAKLS